MMMNKTSTKGGCRGPLALSTVHPSTIACCLCAAEVTFQEFFLGGKFNLHVRKMGKKR